jgi:hypothetical protein
MVARLLGSIRRSPGKTAAVEKFDDRRAPMIIDTPAKRAATSADDGTPENLVKRLGKLRTYDLKRQDAWQWLFGIARHLLRRATGQNILKLPAKALPGRP